MMPPPIRAVRAAFVFLTRVPVGGFPYSPSDFRWAPAHFPLVGLVVGAWGALVLVLGMPLGAVVASVLCVTSLVCVTGAFHEDGLADTADALGGHHDRAKMFLILKDSRIGTYGACALGLSLTLRVAALAELVRRASDSSEYGFLAAPAALMLVQSLSRSGPVCLMAALPYVSAEGAKSSAVTNAVSAPQVCGALGWVLLIAAGFAAAGAPLTLLACYGAVTVVTTALLGRWFLRRAGGYTGDFLGASQQVLDVVLLLTTLSFARALGA